MANYHTQFSFMLVIPDTSPEGVTKAETWLDGQIKEEKRLLEEDYEAWYDNYGGLEFSLELDFDGIWVRSDESGNVEAAIIFVQNFLKAMDVDKGFFFSWADTCSKLRLGGFSGGGVVVTKDDVVVQNSYSVIEQVAGSGIEMLDQNS